MRTLPLLGVVLAITACASGPASPTPGAPVSLVVNINHALFAVDAVLEVDLWNASQLSSLDADSRCAIVQGPGGTQAQCPPGVTYITVVPERVQVPLSTLGATLEVSPHQIAAGEMFRIHLSAISRDGCNSTSADFVRMAASGQNLLGDPTWQTTALGCLSPPGL
jgi:hypothetical protein